MKRQLHQRSIPAPGAGEAGQSPIEAPDRLEGPGRFVAIATVRCLMGGVGGMIVTVAWKLLSTTGRVSTAQVFAVGTEGVVLGAMLGGMSALAVSVPESKAQVRSMMAFSGLAGVLAILSGAGLIAMLAVALLAGGLGCWIEGIGRARP